MALRKLAALTLAATALAGSLIGATGTASASGTQQDFATQAKKAGLSAPQGKELQNRVDGYLKTLGGKQVAANKIEIKGGSVLLALPGEERARDLSGAKAKFADCDYGNFCMFRGTYYTGDKLSLYYCKDYGLTNWVGNGSWWNRQTPGTQARLLGKGGGLVTITPGAESWEAVYNWDPIWTVRPC
ncbi:peptidase inhibitor family I36 protein [Streptomyces abikoensis]|uniref:peptidase inhibitor family I36 protein n=1 Tax=Streptomyces abikoensis TaxID=97398 RepID=UPI0033F90C33